MTGKTLSDFQDYTNLPTDTRDISNLLGRAGLTMLTVDIEEVKVTYPSMWELLEDLQDMGESNAVLGRYLKQPTKVLFGVLAHHF